LKRGFTLTELLIVLMLLGVISTFTIPKVLQSSSNAANMSIYREAQATLAEALQVVQSRGSLTAGLSPAGLTQYINFVRPVSSGFIDCWGYDCDCGDPQAGCIQLHNGAVLVMNSTYSFGGLTQNNYVTFFIDPDGKLSSPRNGYGIDLYANGRVTIPEARTPSSVTFESGAPAAWSNWTWGPPAWYRL